MADTILIDGAGAQTVDIAKSRFDSITFAIGMKYRATEGGVAIAHDPALYEYRIFWPSRSSDITGCSFSAPSTEAITDYAQQAGINPGDCGWLEVVIPSDLNPTSAQGQIGTTRLQVQFRVKGSQIENWVTLFYPQLIVTEPR